MKPKPCPFCGKEPIIWNSHINNKEYAACVTVECPNEGRTILLTEWNAPRHNDQHFCPNCEKECDVNIVAEIYECKECGQEYEQSFRAMKEE